MNIENDFNVTDDSTGFSELNPLVEVITIQGVFDHPNADALELISPDGSNLSFAIAKKGQFKTGDKALWFDAVNEPMVPVDFHDFKFLEKNAKNGYARIKSMRLRGEVSRGLLINYSQEWDGLSNKEISDLLMIKKREAGTNSSRPGGRILSGDACSGPSKLRATEKYDLEPLTRYWRYIPNGTKVVVTEKIHGANASFGWLPFNGEYKFWARSRTQFKKSPEDSGKNSAWWDVAIKLSLPEKLQDKKDLVLMGEVYGAVQDLKYGLGESINFAVFDCWNSKEFRYLTFEELKELCNEIGVDLVPIVTEFMWNTDSGIPKEIISLSNGMSLVPGANNIREGVVVRADFENEFSLKNSESEDRISLKKPARFISKLVGSDYLLRK